jgi:hypothetical protein
MTNEVRTAYLFQCTGEGLFAVSLDITGGNIPRTSCTEGWVLSQEFLLGIHEDVPALIMPEPIIRGVRKFGYYIWRDQNALVREPRP